MKTALNRTPGQAARDGGMFKSDADAKLLLAYPQLVARIDFNTDEFFPDRVKHVRQIALVVLKARGAK